MINRTARGIACGTLWLAGHTHAKAARIRMPAPERQRLVGILPDRRGSWQISADRMRAGIAPAAVGLRARVGGTLKDSNRRLTSQRPAFITQTRSEEPRVGKACYRTGRTRG